MAKAKKAASSKKATRTPSKALKSVKAKSVSNSPTKKKAINGSPAKSKANTSSPTNKPNESKPKKMEKTVFTRDTSIRRTVIIAHNGGNFGPDNSMKNFKGAIQNKAEGIEFDVSANFCQNSIVLDRCG